MTDKKMLKLTGARLMEVRSAFLMLQGRKLPPVSDMRVAMLFSSLRPAIDRYLEKLKDLQVRQDDAERLEEGSEERKRLEKEISTELLEMTNAPYELPAPSRRLTEADLPQALKIPKANLEVAAIAAAAMNDAGRAQIAVALSPEFFELKNPDAEKDGPQLVDDDDES